MADPLPCALQQHREHGCGRGTRRWSDSHYPCVFHELHSSLDEADSSSSQPPSPALPRRSRLNPSSSELDSRHAWMDSFPPFPPFFLPFIPFSTSSPTFSFNLWTWGYTPGDGEGGKAEAEEGEKESSAVVWWKTRMGSSMLFCKQVTIFLLLALLYRDVLANGARTSRCRGRGRRDAADPPPRDTDSPPFLLSPLTQVASTSPQHSVSQL